MNKAKIFDFIKKGKIPEVIDLLLVYFHSQIEMKNEVLTLSARYSFFESKIRTGVIDDETIARHHSKIVLDLLKIVETIEPNDDQNFKRNDIVENDTSETELIGISSGYPNLSPFLKNAVKFNVWGAVISTTISKHTSDMIELLKRGGQIRLLISTPTKEVLDFQQFRSSMITDKEYMLNITMNSINSALLIGDQTEKGCLEIRSIPYLPDFGIIEVGFQGNKSKVLARMSGFKSSSGRQPVLKIENGYWQEYFSEQFEKLWETGATISRSNIDGLYTEWRKLLSD